MSHIPQKLIRAGSTFEQKCSCGWAGLGHTAHEAMEAIDEHILETEAPDGGWEEYNASMRKNAVTR